MVATLSSLSLYLPGLVVELSLSYWLPNGRKNEEAAAPLKQSQAFGRTNVAPVRGAHRAGPGLSGFVECGLIIIVPH